MLGWKAGPAATLVVLVVLVAGCGGSPVPGAGTPAALVDGDCPPLGCGLNGSWLGDNIPFRELDLGIRLPAPGRPEGLRISQPNSANLKIESFHKVIKKAGVPPRGLGSAVVARPEIIPLDLDVEGDELVGIDPRGERLRGDALVGTVITLARTTTIARTAASTTERFLLSIDGVKSDGFWTERCAPESSACDRVRLYDIKFTKQGDADDQKVSICSPLIRWLLSGGVRPGPIHVPDEPPGPGSGSAPPATLRPHITSLGGGSDYAAIAGLVVIFRGDQYIETGFQVRSDPESTWFNITCAGTAIGKLHMLRHTSASSHGGPTPPRSRCAKRDGRPTDTDTFRDLGARITTVPQRQALLRMLTADYCGVGHSFTINGLRLAYTFNQAWEPQIGYEGRPTRFAETSIASIDALWDSNGAVCIGTPRLQYAPPVGTDTAGAATTLMQQIRATCGANHPLPPCAARVSEIKDTRSVFCETDSYAVSANPDLSDQEH
jgi:hypothetical protein